MAEMASRVLSPEDVKAMLRDGDEIALLDVREEGVFSEDGHPFFANSVPLSRLELMIRDLVPRRGTRIVLLDGGDDHLAERAAAKLERMGYGNVAVMAGGSKAWAAAGFELFTGVNVPSKAFGELVEHRSGTPHIAAAELKRRLDAGEEILIVDSRPIGEFRNMSIPGAFDCPGAELVYRVPDRLRFAGQPGRRQLRRPHAQHHRRPVAAQCRPRRTRSWRSKTARWAGSWPGSNWRAGARTRCRHPRPRGWQRRARSPTRSPNASASRASTTRRWPASRARPSSARSTSSTCAAPRNTKPDTSRLRARLRAASSCRRPTPIWRRATPASCWSMTTACAR